MTTRTTVTIPDDVHDSLVDQAAQEQRSVSSVVVEHLQSGMSSREGEAPSLPWADAVAIAREAIRKGMPNEQALEMGRETYPTLTPETVKWIRWDLRIKRGEDVPTTREARHE